MDILLVSAPTPSLSSHAGQAPPLGLSYIAAVLIKAGYDVSVMDFNVSGFHPRLVKGILERETPRIVGISAHTETYLRGLMIAEFVKQVNPDITVVMGGTHPTVMYQEVAREKNVDVVVMGEGEYTMLELADSITKNKNSLAQVKGIAYLENGAVKITPERPLIKDLDELPFPARGLFPLPMYESPATVLLSRGGCPFNCHFCAVNNIWKGGRRFRNPEKVVEEIICMLKYEESPEIDFDDDTFTLDRRRVMELCGLLKKTLQLRWRCSTRVDLVDMELLKEMHAAGCYSIQYGIEAGSQKILDSIGKKITPKQVREAVRATIDVGIEVTCSFMFPHPEDTEETIGEQKQLMKELMEMGSILTMTSTTPLPGTYLYDHADELGIKILADSWDDYDGKKLIITTKYLSEQKIKSLLADLLQDVGLIAADTQGELG